MGSWPHTKQTTNEESTMKTITDTKIGFDGVQRVHGGDGFFEDGKVIA